MGFRYRKSINLGGGFRINLSKSGIGYSWGVKGYRITKTAKGNVRRTISFPGTGISYVEETGRGKRRRGNANHDIVPNASQSNIDNNHYGTEEIVNNVATDMVSEGLEDMLLIASNALRINNISNIGIGISLVLGFMNPLLFLLCCVFIPLKVYVKSNGMIDLNYIIDEDQKATVDEIMQPMIKVTQSNKVWRIIQSSKVIDKKYSGGAGTTVKRIPCKATTTAPFPFKTNLKVASFKAGNETLLFLPDKLFIIQGNKIGALNYRDIESSVYTTRFIESEVVPTDANVVDHTWQYMNKSGGPDKRFKNNRKLPICLYGKVELKSTSGLNTVIMFSNSNMN